MKFVPRKWQTPITDFILDTKRGNVWASMGSGKTSATLSALDILAMGTDSNLPALVLGPLRVARDVWPNEVNEWDHLRGMKVVPIIGTEMQRRLALNTKADIYTMNYENIPWLMEQLNGNWRFPYVIADESTKLKGFRIKAGGERASTLAKIIRKTKRWTNLTGTPSPNGLKDLWGQNFFIDTGQRLGHSYTAFKDRWFDYNPYDRSMTPKKFAHEQIIEALKPVTLTIDIKDYMDIKDPIERTVWVDLPSKQMAQYRELEQKMMVALEKNIELIALTGAAKSTKCLQYAAGAVYYEDEQREKQWHTVHDGKLDALDSIVNESGGAPVCVFYWWKHDAERILKKYPHARVLKTSQDEKDWNAGKIELLLCHPKSAGHGLNLQHGGNIIVWFSVWWDAEVYDQANQRLGPVRQMQSGYNRPVYQYHILTRRTLDEDVLDALHTKSDIQTGLMNAMKRRKK